MIPQLRNISTYAHALFLGIRSDDLTSSILAATMKSFMLNPPAVQSSVFLCGINREKKKRFLKKGNGVSFFYVALIRLPMDSVHSSALT